MLSISADKIDSLFELIGSKQPLYLPVDNNSGKADFKKWEKLQSLQGLFLDLLLQSPFQKPCMKPYAQFLGRRSLLQSEQF